MKTMTVGELKTHFSEVLAQLVENGEPIAISYGRKKEKVAAIIPYSQLKQQGERSLLEAMDAIPGGESIDFEPPKLKLSLRTAQFED